MEDISLNQDVIHLILDLLDDKATLISTKIRDRYFRKNGISINLEHILRKDIDCFPDKFYEYPLELDVRYSGYQSGLSVLFYIIRNECTYLDSEEKGKFADYVFNKTVLMKGLRFSDLQYFPNLKRVKHTYATVSESVVYFLEKTKIVGCILGLDTRESLDKFAKKIEDIDCEIDVGRELHQFLSTKMLEKIIFGRFRLGQIKKCPNLKTINIDDETLVNCKSTDFPNLKKFYFASFNNVDILDKIPKYLPNIRKLCAIDNDKITDALYEKIVKHGYHVKFILVNEHVSLKEILKMYKKWGGGNIIISYHPTSHYLEEMKYIKQVCKLFRTEINPRLMYVEKRLKFFELLLSDPEIHNSKLFKIKELFGLSNNDYDTLRNIYGKKLCCFADSQKI